MSLTELKRYDYFDENRCIKGTQGMKPSFTQYCLLSISPVFFTHQLIEEEQAAELATVTEKALEFTSLDFAIAGLVMKSLVNTETVTNNVMVCC